jgi:uncharacterized membrane protein
MSQTNGEKARASITKRRRTAQRMKDRAAVAAAKAGTNAAAPAAKEKGGK